MLHHLFDAFSLWFWMLVAALFLIEVAVAESESSGWGFLWLAIWLAAIMCFSDFNPFPWVVAHWLATIVLVIVYAAVGILYAIFRWALLVRDPEEYRRMDYKFDTAKPKHLDPNWYRDRIISWMMWWPPSLTWYLLRWPRKIFAAAYSALYATFVRMAQSAAPNS